jgi:2,3-diaminopropionate biosynthesis protein SbnA
MPIITEPDGYNAEDVYVDIQAVLGIPLFLKCEGFNWAGSIKLKAAAEMVRLAESDGILRPGGTLVESSSGNLGVALSMIAASRGYGFICVTDPRCTMSARRMMESFGSQVQVVTEPAAEGGLLGARLRRIRELRDGDSSLVWLNQYANPANWLAHYRITGPAITAAFPELDVLFIGTGTGGTLMGCARYFREYERPVTIVAVDAVGSVTFGVPPALRMLPGLGMSVRSALVDESYVDDVVHVSEPDAVRTCRMMAARGFLLGGSTGSVVSGASRWLANYSGGEDLTSIAISPDLGERYLTSIFHPGWVREHIADFNEPDADDWDPLPGLPVSGQ